MANRLSILVLLMSSVAVSAADIPNPLIDYGAFVENVTFVGMVREGRRVSERDFMRMAREPATVILDARSAENSR